MKQSTILMDMPITVEIQDSFFRQNDISEIFEYFRYIDDIFSTFNSNSQVTKINRRLLKEKESLPDVREVFALCRKTHEETKGYFDFSFSGHYDPSGLVKGWAIYNAGKILTKKGYRDYYIDAGGDIQVAGKTWRVGIRNPFNRREIIKVLEIKDKGVATSGTYIRGNHIHNPITHKLPDQIVSLTVVGPNIFEADRMATAAFAMGRQGIYFLEQLKGFEAYLVDVSGVATYTTNFAKYAVKTDRKN